MVLTYYHFIVQIQNVILGFFTNFPDRGPWGFEPSSLQLTMEHGSGELQIMGYKVGDVNGNANPKS